MRANMREREREERICLGFTIATIERTRCQGWGLQFQRLREQDCPCYVIERIWLYIFYLPMEGSCSRAEEREEKKNGSCVKDAEWIKMTTVALKNVDYK